MTISLWIKRVGCILLIPVVAACTTARAYPVCYYTSNMDQAARQEALEGLMEGLPKISDGLLVEQVGRDDVLIIKGRSTSLAELDELWPDLGCIGQSTKSSDVVKRERCRADMVLRVDSPPPVLTSISEGTDYHCRPLE